MLLHRLGPRLAAALLLGLMVLSIAAFLPGVTTAEDGAAADNLLSVTGIGTLDVRPDTARISLGVSSLADTANDSYARAAAAMNNVVGTVQAQGVARDDITTSNLSLHAEYDWRDGQQTLRGYRTSATITITTRDLSGIGALIDAAVANGANQVQGVSFLVKDQEQHLNQALDAAVDDARAKAERVAARLGTAVVGVRNVQIVTQGGGHRPPIIFEAQGKAAAMDAAMPVMTGTSEYSVTVHVTFKLR